MRESLVEWLASENGALASVVFLGWSVASMTSNGLLLSFLLSYWNADCCGMVSRRFDSNDEMRTCSFQKSETNASSRWKLPNRSVAAMTFSRSKRSSTGA